MRKETSMRKVSLLLCPVLLLAISGFGQQLTPADREKGLQYLRQTKDSVAAAVKGLSDAQLNFKPAPDRWPVAETLEHIAVSEDSICRMLQTRL
jgi:DinB superfamily